MLSEKFNRQFGAGGLVVIGLLMMLNMITRGALPTERTIGLIFVVGGVGLWIWYAYYWTATRPAVSRRMAMWRLVGTVLSLAAIPLIAAGVASALALFAVIAIGITTSLITLAERDWQLAAWERHVLPAMFVGEGLVVLWLIPWFAAYLLGVPMQEVANSPSIAANRWVFTTIGGILLVFGIGLWVWATRAKAARASR
jgi:hypothetical protein